MANEKVKELLEDKKFLEELETTASIEDVQKLFQSKGCEISLDELTAFFKTVTGAELNDKALEAVAGGTSAHYMPIHELLEAIKNGTFPTYMSRGDETLE